MMMATVAQIGLMSILCTVLLADASNDRTATRGQPGPGGLFKLNVTDTQVQAVAAEATAHQETLRNSGKVYRLHEVISAKYQLVRGTIYYLALRIGETDCIREPNVNVEDCQFVTFERCIVIVWVWQNTSDFVNFTCRKERPMLGAEQKIDVDNEELQQVAAFATAELTSRSNGRYRAEHRCISKATSQVVAGAMYRMTMMVAVTSPDDSKSKTARCTVKVWDQAWRTPRYTLEEYKCNRLIS